MSSLFGFLGSFLPEEAPKPGMGPELERFEPPPRRLLRRLEASPPPDLGLGGALARLVAGLALFALGFGLAFGFGFDLDRRLDRALDRELARVFFGLGAALSAELALGLSLLSWAPGVCSELAGSLGAGSACLRLLTANWALS